MAGPAMLLCRVASAARARKVTIFDAIRAASLPLSPHSATGDAADEVAAAAVGIAAAGDGGGGGDSGGDSGGGGGGGGGSGGAGSSYGLKAFRKALGSPQRGEGGVDWEATLGLARERMAEYSLGERLEYRSAAALMEAYVLLAPAAALKEAAGGKRAHARHGRGHANAAAGASGDGDSGGELQAKIREEIDRQAGRTRGSADKEGVGDDDDGAASEGKDEI